MSKTVLITGASRGIGLSLSKQYLEAGWEVYGSCRTASSELTGLGAHVIDAVELSDENCIRGLKDRLSGIRFDVLICNAGILNDDQLGSIESDSLEIQFKVNSIAPLLIVEVLHNQLNANAKVALITSRMGSIADNSSGGRYGYRMSKAALNAAGVSLAHDLKPRSVSVGILHPGFVSTDMVGGSGNIMPDDAAAGIMARIDALNLHNTGLFWHANGDRLPW